MGSGVAGALIGIATAAPEVLSLDQRQERRPGPARSRLGTRAVAAAVSISGVGGEKPRDLVEVYEAFRPATERR